MELTLERLSQIFCYIEESRHRRSPYRYKGKDIRCCIRIRKVCEIIHKSEWYRVGQLSFVSGS